MAEQTTTEPQETTEAGTPKRGGVISRDAAYRKTASHFDKALATIVELLDSRNDNIRLGAANKILDKCIADIKAVELSGTNGEPIQFNIISGADYLSAIGKLNAASETSIIGRSSEIQSADLAPESTQNNNSNQSVSEVVSTQS